MISRLNYWGRMMKIQLRGERSESFNRNGYFYFNMSAFSNF